MDEQVRRSIAGALDTAIADAASTALAEASRDWSDDRKGRELRQAFGSLHDRLANLEMPDYRHPLAPALYALWYHPFQVNLAYASFLRIAQRRGGRLTDRAALYVADFGCGALAAKFGLWLAALELLCDGQPAPRIGIDLIDDSADMVAMGERIGERFETLLTTLPDLPVRLPAVETRRINGIVDVNVPPDSERWLAALHAFYRPRQDDIRDTLADLYARITPTLGLLTFHRDNYGMAEYVSPFASDLQDLEICRLPLSGDLPRTTRRRQSWLQEFSIVERRGGEDRRRVQWAPVRGLRDNVAFTGAG